MILLSSFKAPSDSVVKQATSFHMSQWWHNSPTHIWITSSAWLQHQHYSICWGLCQLCKVTFVALNRASSRLKSSFIPLFIQPFVPSYIKENSPRCWVFVTGIERPQVDVDCLHDDVIKWKHFPCYWPYVRGIHRSPVNSPHKGQWRGTLIFSLICIWINGWVNNREAGDLRRYRAHSDVSVMFTKSQ